MDQLIDAEARDGAGRQDPRRGAQAARAARGRPTTTRRRSTDASVRSAAATDNPIPTPPFWGVRELEVPMDEVYRHLDTHVLFKLHWGGRGVKGEAWTRAGARGLPAAAGAHVARADLPAPARAARLLPLQLRRQRADRVGSRGLRPGDARARAPRVPAPAPARPHLPGRLLPAASGSGELDVVALQAVTAGERGDRADGHARGRRRVRRAAVRPRPRRADRRGDGRVAARPRPLASSASTRRRAAATRGATPPAPSSPSTRRCSALLDAPSIGLRLSGGYAVEPEQSTLAIVAHHPQAVYFGMKSGLLPKTRQAGRRRADRAAPTRTRRGWPTLTDADRRGRGRRRRRRRAGDGRAPCRPTAASTRDARRRRRSSAGARGQLDRRRVHRAQADLAPGHALLEQRRHAHQDRGRDLDRLQDHAVGDARRRSRRASRCAARPRRRPGRRRGWPAWPAAPR